MLTVHAIKIEIIRIITALSWINRINSMVICSMIIAYLCTVLLPVAKGLAEFLLLD